MEDLIKDQLGNEFGYEWTSVAYQETQAGNTTTIVFIMALLVAFLVLAAQYESWTSPLISNYGIANGFIGSNDRLFCHGDPCEHLYSDRHHFTDCPFCEKRNASIVEFARDFRAEGNSIRDAAYEAGHVRLRPILMTSFAFVLGVMPLSVRHRGWGAKPYRTRRSCCFRYGPEHVTGNNDYTSRISTS